MSLIAILFRFEIMKVFLFLMFLSIKINSVLDGIFCQENMGHPGRNLCQSWVVLTFKFLNNLPGLEFIIIEQEDMAVKANTHNVTINFTPYFAVSEFDWIQLKISIDEYLVPIASDFQ